ncbi:hypothetical protein ZYGR_0N01600 [Zygosaccharomyces rouxii]|uniref:ZYRO0D04048p n=2 Tax=Zygosaccharomyces rouxii TaxID=4956 RepID=C5DV57_ZYGRC|nr:uncharacterized protein ZYRO0D04048g [Zygosaccharomyces rouxii]KAH9200589.1 hypothetical protein LQ764DRAFT_96987 [Zygosaccharomyces rouxii]GAV48755.1 hypothetical protein ZYGR_0N01600 [Zygosaccharomyces rouxii]CAR27676.1 ZYRO0D04048p [Zygosaccharomyces rouxii]
MTTKEETRALHTPPMSNTKFDTTQSIKESYRPQSGVTQEDSNEGQGNGNSGSQSHCHNHVELSKEDIDREVNSIEQLPVELSKLIDLFINDLKQPKYVKPLTIIQLSSLFQNFYIKFDKASFQYLSTSHSNSNGTSNGNGGNNNNGNTDTNNSNNVNGNNNNLNGNGNGNGNSNDSQPAFLVARETLSSGLSGIFARSRSGSGSSLRRGRRSSSLFSVDSNNVQPLLSPEEIQKQLRTNELNNYKIDKFMSLCEREVFRRILEVGTSVASPSKEELVTRSNHQKKTFNVSSLFRNSPEFIEFDKVLYEKLHALSTMATQNKIDLVEFLRLPIGKNPDLESQEGFDGAKELLTNLVSHTIAPCEKIAVILKIHESMMFSQEMCNDDFLSMLVYYIIKVCPKNIFLNAQFIKLFRNKKKLVQQEMYALTNFEAALVFVEGLTFTDFIPSSQEKLTNSEKDILQTPVSNKISLPSPLKNSGAVNVDVTLHETHPEAMRSNSYDGFKYAFDTSLKNIFGKIRSYTPPVQPINLPRSSSTLSLEADKKISTSPTRAAVGSQPVTATPSSSTTTTATATATQLPEVWKKYKDRKFEDLKVSDMKEIFEIYQKLMG